MGFTGSDSCFTGKGRYIADEACNFTGKGRYIAGEACNFTGKDRYIADEACTFTGKGKYNTGSGGSFSGSARDFSYSGRGYEDSGKENSGRKRTIRPYNRDKAVQYAHMWAYGRNPAYYDFEKLGGDCTNFASQCIYAGSSVMNYTPVYGWYYINSYNRTASWTGVNYLYDFLVNNSGEGPFAEEVDVSDVEPGDIAQVSFYDSKRYNHSPVVVKVANPQSMGGILVAAHTFDTDYYRLLDFEPAYVRFLHIKGVRV